MELLLHCRKASVKQISVGLNETEVDCFVPLEEEVGILEVEVWDIELERFGLVFGCYDPESVVCREVFAFSFKVLSLGPLSQVKETIYLYMVRMGTFSLLSCY